MNKRVSKNILWLGLSLFLLLDIGYTFFQHSTKELDGDLVAIVLFANQYEDLKGQPFGWKAISEGKHYGGVNRFFVHWFMSNYFKTVPFLLQKIVSPVDSIYYAAAILKTLTHVFLLTILSLLVSGAKRLFTRKTLIAAAIIAPLLQSAGAFYGYFGVVDQSVTYCSFYALPLVLLLWFLKPYYNFFLGKRKKLSIEYKVFLTLLVIILPFSGPLIPGVIAVICGLLVLMFGMEYIQFGHSELLSRFPMSLRVFFLILVVLSLYSIFLGRYNVESLETSLSLMDRYRRLPFGLYFQLTQKLAFPLLFLMIGLIIFFYKKYNASGKNLFALLKWISLFALIYILLLPFGGFREYRPNIIRKDTFLPITILLLFFYTHASFLIIQNKAFRYRNWYLALVVVFSLIFMYADEADGQQHRCQKNALITLSMSRAEVVRLSKDCNLLSWRPILKPEESINHADLFQYWNITDQKLLFYQE